MPQQAAVTFHHADAIGWNYPTGEYDAVVTCFFLDCFQSSTLTDWVPHVRSALRPGGFWAVAEFCEVNRVGADGEVDFGWGSCMPSFGALPIWKRAAY